MSEFQKILDSFTIKDTLNPKIWDNPENPKDANLKPKVRKGLLKIAEEFVDYLGDDAFIEDIHLTGSLSNFNWSEFSDFDLHVIVDLKRFEDEEETYKELFNLKKQVFNDKHDIKIYGYDVELYAQSSDEKHESSGVYSIMNDEWINRPEKFKTTIDKSVVENKVQNWVEKIDNAIAELKGESLEAGKEKLETLKNKLKEYRKAGLEKDGELSYENLTFKFLRRNGSIQKLFKSADKFTDKELSIESQLTESIKEYLSESLGDQVSNIVFMVVDKSNFLSKLYDIAKSEKSFEYFPRKIKFDSDVELIQSFLQFLGFSFPKWGIDGKFGPETSQSVKLFQNKYGLTDDGKLKSKDLKYLLAALVTKNFKDEDLSKIQKDKEINLQGLSDKNVYETILKELGAPVSDENLKFLYAWRQSEGKGGKYNPFNTTWKLPGSTKMNYAGVQNYVSLEQGVQATLKTLRNGYYTCIVDGLKNDIGAAQIAKCQSLKTWGTGDLVAKVVANYESGASPNIKNLA